MRYLARGEIPGCFYPTFNLPDISDCFVQGGTPGIAHSAGLPAITGGVNNSFRGIGAFGALYTVSGSDTGYGWGASGNRQDIRFDASRSSSIYGNSTTVQPKSVETLFCIKY